MAMNLAHKLIASHLAEGTMGPGEEIGLKIDQTLTQDATGTLVMLELEAMALDRVKTELSAQYVDHNLLQADFRNADDHRFLLSACKRFGVWFSPPGNGVSHPVHQQHHGRPGASLLGSDSHTCGAGALAMLAIGAGGIDVAMAMAGHAYFVKMPRVLGVKLRGRLPPWVSAKDVILEMLRRHTVKGGLGRIIEYHGPGLESLGVMDRHVIANMGAELGATSTVFPSDARTREFLRAQGREEDWTALAADAGADYDEHDEIDLGALEPLIAMPSSPDNVVPVREVAGQPVCQSYIGSSANPGYRDIAVAAAILGERRVHERVSLDINPASRQTLETLLRDGHIGTLIHAGARLHQTGCNGCIGMGQAPATDCISLRTVPRNFPGRSGTREDKVCLVSPETAAASALAGEIADPRDVAERFCIADPEVAEPRDPVLNAAMLVAPPAAADAREVELVKGPNIASFPSTDPLGDSLELPVLIVVGDNISTDGIMPAGADALPYRSNIPLISTFVFRGIDERYHERAARGGGDGHAIVAGHNYGQGSSREHAVLAPRYLGLRAVLAKSFARIHRQNLINYGVLALTFADETDAERIERDDVLRIERLREQVGDGDTIIVRAAASDAAIETRLDLSPRQREMMLAGGLINWVRGR